MDGSTTPEKAVHWLAENGAEVIELVPFGMDFIADPSLIGRIKNAAKAAGVPLGNFSLNANFLQISPEELEQELIRAKRYIEICHEMEIPCIRMDCSSFRRPLESNTIENFNKELPEIVKAYQILCDYAAPLGISVLLENHGFYVNGSDRVIQVYHGVERKNFGLQLDVGNFICVDEQGDVATKKVAPYAKTVHLKDFYIRSPHRDPGDASQFECSNSWFRSVHGNYLRGSILAQGDLDIYEILSIVKQAGYDGNIFLEYEGMEDCYYATKVSLDNMKRIYSLV